MEFNQFRVFFGYIEAKSQHFWKIQFKDRLQETIATSCHTAPTHPHQGASPTCCGRSKTVSSRICWAIYLTGTMKFPNFENLQVAYYRDLIRTGCQFVQLVLPTLLVQVVVASTHSPTVWGKQRHPFALLTFPKIHFWKMHFWRKNFWQINLKKTFKK